MSRNIKKTFKIISFFMILIFCLPLGCKKMLLKTDYTQQNNVKQHIAALKDEDSEVRWNAAEALRKIGDARTVGPLLDF
jgi:hypothetical protein